MGLTDNPLVADFLDDLADTVGPRNWALYTTVMGAVWLALVVTGVPAGGIIGAVMTGNLLVALITSAWWKYYARPKRALTAFYGRGGSE